MQRYMQVKIKDVSRKAIKLEPGKTLDDARNAMQRYNISRIVVAEGKKAVGILTEKDMARFLYREVPTRRLNEIRLEEVMTKDLITTDEESDLGTAARLMLEKDISSLIITESKGNLKGIVTKSDLVRAYAAHFAGKSLVKDFVSRPVLTVAPDDTTHSVLSIMTKKKVSRVVVVREGKPIGIITGRDLLPMGALFGPDTLETIRQVFASRKEGLVIPSGISSVFLARDVMKHDPITVRTDSDLADAAQIMVRNRIGGLPVVDAGNNLAGMVTRTNIVGALASVNP